MKTNLKLTIIPDSKKNVVRELKPGQLEVKLKAKPERNEANLALKEILAEYFHTSTSNIQIISGHHSHHKRIVIQSKP